MSKLLDRLGREAQYYDSVVLKPSRTHALIDRFTKGFYEKGKRGRLWAPIWETTDFRALRILDYGCGDGAFSCLLASRGAYVCGVDISPKSIGEARTLADTMGLNGFVNFLVCDAHRTPFKAESFDYVVGNGALHHLDLDRAYVEIARVLKPGGKAFFMEPLYHHPLLWLLRRLTPEDHTADERPLSFADIERASRWFSDCSHREHFLLSVCAAPTHLLGRNAALTIIGGLDRIDQLMMSMLPPLRHFAWLTMLELRK